MSNSDSQQLKRVRSGVRGIDEILRGGFFGGGLYIIEGAPGVGKTILGNQICFNQASAGSKVLYVTLIAETVGRMLLSIKRLSFYEEGVVGNGIFYVSGFNALKKDGLTGLLHLLRREVASRHATVLIVDGFASAADHSPSREDLNSSSSNCKLRPMPPIARFFCSPTRPSRSRRRKKPWWTVS